MATGNIYFFGVDEMWSAHLSSLHAQLTSPSITLSSAVLLHGVQTLSTHGRGEHTALCIGGTRGEEYPAPFLETDCVTGLYILNILHTKTISLLYKYTLCLEILS